MKHKLLPIQLLLGGLLLTACVDKSYDLDEIDYTLATNADLALPLINTSEVKLADFVLPKEGEDGFLDKTAIPGQEGEVIYASTSGSFTTSIPALVDGSVDYTANTPDITIPELPDFLKDNNVHLDLMNPIVIAHVKSDNLPAGCDVLADIEISTPEVTCKVNGLKATGTGTKKLCQYIATSSESYIPAKLLQAGYGDPVLLVPASGSINDLFKDKIPEKFEVKVTKLTASGIGAIPVTGDFDISVDLTLYAPLRIGSTNFRLTYDAIETGWEEEFDEDIRKMEIDRLIIKANLINGLPLWAEVTLNPIDPSGNKINGLSVFTVNAPTGKTSPIEYIVTSTKPGVTIRDFLNGSNGAQQLDGVRIVTTLFAGPESVGQYLTDKSYVRFTDLTLRAQGQFSYDAN